MTLSGIIDRIAPSSFHRGHPILVLLALLLITGWALTKLSVPTSVSRIPETLITLFFLFAIARNWRVMRHQPLVWMLGITVLLPPLLLSVNYLIDPESAMRFFGGERFVRLLFFLPIAWFLGGNLRTTMYFLALVFLGYMISILINSDILNLISNILIGQRADFGILNAQHQAMYFGISFLGALCFIGLHRLNSNPAIRGIALATCILIAVISFLGIVATTTRAVWLGIALCTIVTCLFLMWCIIKDPKYRKIGASLLSVVVVSSGALTLLFSDRIISRFEAEMGTIGLLFEGDLTAIPPNSTGLRIHSWIIATDWIAERPLTGWGEKIRTHAINSSPGSSDLQMRNIEHFHNSYFEFGIAYGLIGVLALLSIFAWINFKTWQITQQDDENKPVFYFTALGTIFLLFINLFESYWFFWSGAFITSVTYAPAATIILRNHLQGISENRKKTSQAN
ncbi:MAG: O-antigen ligase family protein [Natronospirillum sp.]